MTYVDDMRSQFGRMKICHLVADTTGELIAMADRIGIARKWIQKAGTPSGHFDVCLSKRRLAVRLGAKEVGTMELGQVIRRKRRKDASDS